MGKQTLLGKIVEYLEMESESRPYADVSPVVLQKFMRLKGAGTAGSVKPAVPKAQAAAVADRAGFSAPLRPSPAKSAEAVGIPAVEPAVPPARHFTRPELDKMDMDQVASEVAGCTLCGLHETRTNTVFGDGNRQADLMFIGEGPGKDEDEQGLPFVGRAGQLLTDMINAMQFSRSDVYIANIVKCRPPGNRNPEDDEAGKCLPYLERQIDIIHPKVIVLLGAVPLRHLLGLTGVTKIRGNWYEYKGIKVMPTLHPAYLLRNPAAKKDAWSDLKKVMAVFGKKHVPKAKAN